VTWLRVSTCTVPTQLPCNFYQPSLQGARVAKAPRCVCFHCQQLLLHILPHLLRATPTAASWQLTLFGIAMHRRVAAIMSWFDRQALDLWLWFLVMSCQGSSRC